MYSSTSWAGEDYHGKVYLVAAIKEFWDFEATLFVDIENAQTNISRKKIFVQRFPKFYVYLCFKNVASKSQTYSIFPSNLHCSVR